jgi:hypothetical protein
MLLKMSILKMSSNTEIREKGECAAVRAVGQGLCTTVVAVKLISYFWREGKRRGAKPSSLSSLSLFSITPPLENPREEVISNSAHPPQPPATRG